MRLLFLSICTTGKDLIKNDIVEVCGKQVDNGRIVNVFKISCQPFLMGKIDNHVLEKIDLSIKEIKGFQKPKKALKEFEKNLSVGWRGASNPYYIVAYNSIFVKKFIEHWFVKGERYDLSKFIDLKCDIDILAMAKILRIHGVINTSVLSLEMLTRFYGIEYVGSRCIHEVDYVYKIYEKMESDIVKCFKDNWKEVPLL